jgi:hypothetical protein
MGMANYWPTYKYSGPNDECRAGRHVDGRFFYEGYGNAPGPYVDHCAFCGLKLCQSLLLDDPEDEWSDGTFCSLIEGHSGNHINQFTYAWWK